MKKNDNRSEQTDPPASSKQTLRRRAEEMAHSPEELEAMSPEETQQTLHELRVHQIELEIQNEELRWVQAELEAERARYFELYDLAPVSYCTISEEGLITEINLTAANLLGVPQGTLTKQPISCFIFEEDQDIYYLHRKQFLEVSEPLGCELRMKKKDGTIFWAEMETTIEKNVDGAPVYRTMLIDITERKQAEATQQHRTASQALLLEISNKFNNVLTEDIDAIITATLQMIGEFDCADRSYTAVFSDDQSTISNTHGWCAEGITAAIDSIRGLPVDRVFPWLKDNLQSLGYTYIPRVADLPPEAQAEKEMLQAQSIQSFIAVPIFMDDKILGFLGCDSVRVEKTWSEDNIIMLKSVAQITSKAMLRQQFAQALQASENYYRTIFENTGAATMIIEEDMTISRVNEDWERAFGFKNEDLIAKKWTDFVVGDMVENMKEYHLRLHHQSIYPKSRINRGRSGMVSPR